MYRKHVVLGCAGLAGALFVVGCSSSDGDETGTPELHVQILAPDSVPSDDAIGPALEDALDIELTLTSASGDDYWTQLSADLAAGTGADLFEVNRNQLRQYIDQGLILDLSEYMDDELAPYYSNANEESLAAGQFDGHDYAIVQQPTLNYHSYWIRKDWLDNLDLDMPETVDDFAEVLEAFTLEDPDGNGKADTYGLGGGDSGIMWRPLWAAFGSGGVSSYGETGGSFYEEDGRVVNSLQDPDTVDALRYIQELVQNGYVDPDFLTIDESRAHERALQGTVGVIETDWPKMTKPEFVEQYQEVQPDAEWVQVGPLAGPAGEGAYPRDLSSVRMEAVPASLADDEDQLNALFDLINYVSEGDGQRLVSFGIEDEHYTLENDQVVATDLMAEEGGYFFLYQLAGRSDEEYLGVKFPDQTDEIAFAADQPVLQLYDSLVAPPEDYRAADAGRFIQDESHPVRRQWEVTRRVLGVPGRAGRPVRLQRLRRQWRRTAERCDVRKLTAGGWHPAPPGASSRSRAGHISPGEHRGGHHPQRRLPGQQMERIPGEQRPRAPVATPGHGEVDEHGGCAVIGTDRIQQRPVRQRQDRLIPGCGLQQRAGARGDLYRRVNAHPTTGTPTHPWWSIRRTRQWPPAPRAPTAHTLQLSVGTSEYRHDHDGSGT